MDPTRDSPQTSLYSIVDLENHNDGTRHQMRCRRLGEDSSSAMMRQQIQQLTTIQFIPFHVPAKPQEQSPNFSLQADILDPWQCQVSHPRSQSTP